MLRNVYPGWWLLAAMTFTVAVVSGLTFHSFTFYITPMEETFGWSRAETSVAAVVNMLVFSISAPLVGGWIDRWGVEKVLGDLEDVDAQGRATLVTDRCPTT